MKFIYIMILTLMYFDFDKSIPNSNLHCNFIQSISSFLFNLIFSYLDSVNNLIALLSFQNFEMLQFNQ